MNGIVGPKTRGVLNIRSPTDRVGSMAIDPIENDLSRNVETSMYAIKNVKIKKIATLINRLDGCRALPKCLKSRRLAVIGYSYFATPNLPRGQ